MVVFKLMKWFLVMLIAVIMIPISPVIFFILKHEYHLLNFSYEIDKIGDKFGESLIELDQSALLEPGTGSGNYVNYVVSRRYFIVDETQPASVFQEEVENISFGSAAESNYPSPSEICVKTDGGFLDVTLRDGPFDAWFDIRFL